MMIYLFVAFWLICGAIAGCIGSKDWKRMGTYEPIDTLLFLTIGLFGGPIHLIIALFWHYRNK